MNTTKESFVKKINIYPKPTKKEKLILRKLFHIFLEKEERKVRISESFLGDTPFQSIEEVHPLLLSLFKKVVTITLDSSNEVVLSIFDLITRRDDFTDIYFSSSLLSLKQKTRAIGLKEFYYFLFCSGKYSYPLYLILKREDGLISIDDLKRDLGITQDYQRYYDLKKHILLPLKEDLRELGNMSLEFEKVKLSPSNKRLISHIRYHLKEDKDIISPEDMTLITEEARGVSTNLEAFRELVSEEVRKHSRTYILRNLNFAKKYYKSNFNEAFQEAIEDNSFYTGTPDYEVLPFHSKTVKFTNLNQLRKDVFLSLNGISIRKKYFTLSSDFSNELYNIRSSLLMDYKFLRIYLEKTGASEILIEVFLRKIKE